MYSIAQIIYGIPLVSNDDGAPGQSEDLELAIEDGEPGFLSYYSGAAPETPAAFGIELGEFDEACAWIDMKDVNLSPTPQQTSQFELLWKSLKKSLQEEIEAKYGKDSKVFILWTTS